ncbi:hypothetical protein BGZ46_007949 [Entomortierella lignicola]|nr:hypothetical protein BGZ46_007949 [Entomortierella lignicola]
MNTPRRIADYFYIVGLRDDTSLHPSDTNDGKSQTIDQPQQLQPQQQQQQQLQQHDTTSTSSGTNRTVAVNTASSRQQQLQQQHQQHQQQQYKNPHLPRPSQDPRRLSYAAIAAANITSPTTSVTTSPDGFAYRGQPSALSNTSAFGNRARSQSMAHFHPPVMPVIDKQDTEGMGLRGPPARPVRQSRRLSTASMVGPPRRPMASANTNNPGNNVLQHKPNYRYVTADALYKVVQEGLEHEKTFDDSGNALSDHHTKTESTEPATRPTVPPSITSSDKSALSVQGNKSMASGKNTSNTRSRSKPPSPTDKTSITEENKETKSEQQDVHPAERVFKPTVICRYPESDWKDAEAFPAFLPMFCFPSELSFRMSDEKPQTTYHSFVLTQETGGRSYAMCVTMYERLPPRMYQQFDAICQQWTRSRMSESEIEYAKAIKSKIFLEKKLLKSLQLQLREEKTMGRRARQAEINREILDSEEKLSLLGDQMKPWRGLFVEAEDAWMPRCVGLVSTLRLILNFDHVSYVKNLIHEVNLPPFGKIEIGITINNKILYATRPALNTVPIVKNFSLFPLFRCLSAEDIVTVIEVLQMTVQLVRFYMTILSEGKVIFVSSYPGMLTLAGESFLFLLFPLYWQGVYIPILPSALMTCLQAPVPYIIGIERRSRDPEFPPEEACVVDLDKGVIEVQLAPTPLPPRQRRKLIQCLEQYAPTCAIRRTAASPNPALGPPAYIKEAFPHSRLSLFCSDSRAPRWSKRVEMSRSLPSVSNGSLPMSQNTLLMNTRGNNGSTNTLPAMSSSELNRGDQTQQQHQPLSYSKVAKGMARSVSEGILDREQDIPPKDGGKSREHLSRAESMKEVSPNSVHSTESFRSTSRKVLSPGRSRTSMFEPRRQEIANNQVTDGSSAIHPIYGRQNSSHSSHMSAIAAGFDSPGLRHRASFTSIESSSSSVMSKSPVSTTTSSTMASINGHSSPTAGALSSEDEVGSSSGGPEKTPPTIIEGHILSPVSSPLPIPLLNYCCGICSRALASHHIVYRCESCSLHIHSGCLDELLHPCIPRGFDESNVCWSVLQMWASLMKGYRNGIIAGAAAQQYQQHSPLQIQQHQFQNYSPRVQGHMKQLSNSGSEGEREGRDRLSWASFQRWTGRNSGSGINNGMSSSNRSSAEQSQSNTRRRQTRSRTNTVGSNQSDTVSFHRDVFLKGVDKDAKPFMSVFTESQAFVQFIQDRVDRSPGDPEIMFFDEVIKAKINRSRFRLGKEDTKFLNDPSYGIQGTVKAIPPSGEFQIYDNDERRFPTKLDPAYL